MRCSNQQPGLRRAAFVLVPHLVYKLAFGLLEHLTGRNPDYLNDSIQFTTDVIKTAFFIDLLPKFLRK